MKIKISFFFVSGKIHHKGLEFVVELCGKYIVSFAIIAFAVISHEKCLYACVTERCANINPKLLQNKI